MKVVIIDTGTDNDDGDTQNDSTYIMTSLENDVLFRFGNFLPNQPAERYILPIPTILFAQSGDFMKLAEGHRIQPGTGGQVAVGLQ